MAEAGDGATVPVRQAPDAAPDLQARRLLRAARAGTLATVSFAELGGQPFASLVTPAVAADGAILLLLSELAEHTRHLRAEPRCSLLVAGAPADVNPQTAPRVTITGRAMVSDTEADRARFLAVHPYAALYAGFGDFQLWRMVPRGGLLVGGFARASRLGEAELLPATAAACAIAASGAAILAHCNTDHAEAMAAIGAAASGRAGAWRMVTVDSEGFDLALEQITQRIAFSAPAADSAGVRSELVRLARASRQIAADR